MICNAEALVVRRGGRTIVDRFSLAVEPGETIGIVGKNGCGKSTLVMAIAGVLAPTEGRVAIDGANVWGGGRERIRARKSLGYVPEAADPPGFLLGGELWAMCAAARGCEAPSPSLIDALGLDELRELALERMSLGQRRRACLGAALLGPPKLLVLDEPDNGLDSKRAEALAELIRAHAAAGNAAIVATHDRDLLERVGARIVALG
ncbi:MAG TPA: ABC transporter ATP-binding protein [Kofleriaceae bacterium]|jgi:ABC-type multidrug transport system ATPase subunit